MNRGYRAWIDALGASPLDTIEHHLRIAEDDRPTPGEGEVLIRIRSANVGWVDLMMMSGQYQHVPEPPYTPGLEYAGEVVAVGRGANAREGDRVIADGLYTGPRSLGAHRRWGGFATYAIAPATALVPLPKAFSYDEGACLLGGAETAYHALVFRARVEPSDTVLILGATGSTGLAAVALAKRLGATVIAAGRTASKLEVTRTVGADHVVTLGEGTSLRDEVKTITDGRGASVVYDAVGGPLTTEALRASAYGARFVVVGWSSTPFAGRKDGANVIPTNLVLMKSIDVLGSPAAIAVHKDPSLRTERLEKILGWANEGSIRPTIGASFGLQELEAALNAKWSSTYVGNVVVHP